MTLNIKTILSVHGDENHIVNVKSAILAFTCLHIIAVTEDFSGGPGGVLAGFCDLIELVLYHMVPM